MKKLTSVVAAVTLAVGIVTGVGTTQAQEQTTELQLFKMYDTEEGTYLLDPTAEFENVIFVPKKEAIAWGVYKIHHGTKVTGVFDETGWELYNIKK